jgi:hypothetical protein
MISHVDDEFRQARGIEESMEASFSGATERTNRGGGDSTRGSMMARGEVFLTSRKKKRLR